MNMENQLAGFLLWFDFLGMYTCQPERTDLYGLILRKNLAHLLQCDP